MTSCFRISVATFDDEIEIVVVFVVVAGVVDVAVVGVVDVAVVGVVDVAVVVVGYRRYSFDALSLSVDVFRCTLVIGRCVSMIGR